MRAARAGEARTPQRRRARGRLGRRRMRGRARVGTKRIVAAAGLGRRRAHSLRGGVSSQRAMRHRVGRAVLPALSDSPGAKPAHLASRLGAASRGVLRSDRLRSRSRRRVCLRHDVPHERRRDVPRARRRQRKARRGVPSARRSHRRRRPRRRRVPSTRRRRAELLPRLRLEVIMRPGFSRTAATRRRDVCTSRPRVRTCATSCRGRRA